MKQSYFLSIFLVFILPIHSQTLIAIQDFEITPTTPTWTFTGVPNYNSGISASSAAPANSPIGINNSRAWETTQISAGLTVEFSNIAIPTVYDEILFEFKLAAMNLNGSSGGPDDLDYVLVEYSLDNGSTFYNRLRIRGALHNNSFWAYDATGIAIVDYQPTNEVLFQPTNSGLATENGYSTVGILFPGTINQLKIKITARSSSSSDTWLIDNVRLLGGSGLLNNDEFTINQNKIKLYPNPSSDFIKISGLSKNENFSIYNLLGEKIKNGTIGTNEAIDIHNFSDGLYFLKLENGNTIKFLKE